MGSKPVEIVVGNVPEGDEYLVGDALRLGQVLVNLAGNAVKFTSSGSVILSIDETSRDREKQKVCLRFSVKDTGIGIPADQLGNIFKPFSQADTSTTRKLEEPVWG